MYSYLAAHGTGQMQWVSTLKIPAGDRRPSGKIWMETFPGESNFRLLPKRYPSREAALKAARRSKARCQ